MKFSPLEFIIIKMTGKQTKAPKATILVVDDTPLNLRFLSGILGEEGYAVRGVSDGAVALSSVQADPPDLILLDIMMPVFSGYEVCEKLKADELTRDIPVIFISALNEVTDKVKGFCLGGVDYITKPFQIDEVLARVKTHLDLRNLQKKLQEKANELHRAKKTIEAANRTLEERVRKELEKRRKQQELLIHKSKLESLGTLAAGIAHEINQPLSGIAMGVENIYIKVTGNKISNDYLEKECQLLLEDVSRIKHIIDHIRIFSREQQSVFFENVNINEVVENAMLMLRTQYESHNIILSLDLDKKAGVTVGNKYKLEQVVINLLSNSKDALEEKGDMLNNTSMHKEIKIKTSSRADKIFLEIEDNGKGIDRENMEKMFEPFFTTKDPDKGTGLGLSISYGIIKEMKGEISVKSKIDEYTKITVSLLKIKSVKLEI
ncbi:MAG: response regulator [Desulfobacterales bacterium]|nr:response regulator [Desulfobacterales bacterium]